jgi:hypothetical protein
MIFKQCITDLEHRIAALTESIDSGRYDRDPQGKTALQFTRLALMKIVEDWKSGKFYRSPVTAVRH